jgi:hypothetical protein
MKEKEKTVEVSGQRWMIRRMTPVAGSYIWQRLMAAMFKAQAAAPQVEEDSAAAAQTEEAVAKATPEQRLRGMCGVAFTYLTFVDTEFIQAAAMKVTSRIENLAGVDTPMPVMMNDGRYAIAEIADDPFLVTRLTMEALVFNLASFLEESGA